LKIVNFLNLIKKWALLLVISIFSLTANAQSLKIGLIDHPPHLSFDEDLKNSPLYQYINNILVPMGFTVDFIKLPRKRASIELSKGNIDLLLPTSVNDKTLKTLTSPIFHSVPGLCFKKENFIPILSAIHRLDKLTIGVPINSSPVPALTESKAKLIPLNGKNATSRGIDMTQRGRIDAVYHPSPLKVYHRKNPMYKELACSYFHGYSTPIYIAVSDTMPTKLFNLINNAYQKSITKISYEYYFANRE